MQISVYSHRAEVHDAITKLPGSLQRTIAAVRLLVERGVKVVFANVLMRENFQDYPGVQALAAEVGARVYHRPDHYAHDGWGPLHPEPEY